MVQRERDPGSLLPPQNSAVAVIVGVVFVVGAIAWGSLKLGLAWAGATADVPNNPLNVLLRLAAGDLTWPRQATYAAAILAAAITAVAVGLVVLVRWLRRRRTRVDHAARHLGKGRDIAGTSRTAVAATADRLGVVADTPGVLLGRTVAGDAEVWSSWEDPRRHPRPAGARRRRVEALRLEPGTGASVWWRATTPTTTWPNCSTHRDPSKAAPRTRTARTKSCSRCRSATRHPSCTRH
jgi:hypothetical protein